MFKNVKFVLLAALAATGLQALAALTSVNVISDSSSVSVTSDIGSSASWNSVKSYYAKKLTCNSYITAGSMSGSRFLGWYTLEDDDDSSFGNDTSPDLCTVLIGTAAKLTSSQIGKAKSGCGAIGSAPVACPKYIAVYSVTASASPSGYGSVSIASSDSKYASEQTIAVGETCTLTAKAQTGYKFKEWQKNSVKVSSSNPYQFTVSSVNSGAYTAVFVAQTYTVTLNPSGGSGEDKYVTATYGQAMPQISSGDLPTRSGYTFGGYYTQQNGGGTCYYNADGSSARSWDKTGNETLYAKWSGNSYELKLVVNTGIAKIQYKIGSSQDYTDVTTSTTLQVPYGTTWWAKAVAKTGYTTSSAVTSRTMDENGYTYSPTATKDEYTVTLSPSGGSGYDLIKKVAYGQAMPTVSASEIPTKTGHTFDGYFEYAGGQGNRYYNADGTSARNWDKTASATLRANWLVNSYDLTLEVNTGIEKIQYRISPSEVWIDVTSTTVVKVPYDVRWYAKAVAKEDYQTSSEVTSQQMDEIGQKYSPTATREGWTLTVDPKGGEYRGLGDKTVIPELRLKTGFTNLNSIGVATCPGKKFIGFWCDNEQVYDAEGHNIKGSYWSESYDTGVFIGSKEMTVEARWSVKYSIAFDANGGEGTMAPVSNISYDAEIKLPLNTFTRGIRTFAHWTATVDKVERQFEDGETVSRLSSVNDSAVTLFAVWNDEYAIGFDGNGATSGKMNAQVFANQPGQSEALSANTYERTDYVYGGWAKTKARADQYKVDYTNQQEISTMPAFARVGETNNIYAVWNPKYTIAFNGNGGKGKMESITMVYGEAKALPAMAFTRDPEFWSFNCWSNRVTGCTYADGATVSNLTEVAGSTVELYAMWNSKLTDLSLAMGCENLIWETEGGDWHAIYNYGYDDKSCVASAKNDTRTSYGLYASVHTNGTLSFMWTASQNNAEISIGLSNKESYYTTETFVSGRSWQKVSIEVDGEVFTPATTEKCITITIYNENDDGVEVYIDQMKWIPVNYAPEPGPGDEATISGVSIENGKFNLSFTGDERFGYNLLTNGNLSVDGWGVRDYKPGEDGEMSFEPEIDSKFNKLFYKVETIQKK